MNDELQKEIEATSTDLSGVQDKTLHDLLIDDSSEYFYNTIMRLANERTITPDDFSDFVGQTAFLLLDYSDMHYDFKAKIRSRNPLSEGASVTCEFSVRRTFGDEGKNMVEIIADVGQRTGDWVLMHLDADELAIRMDAA